MAFSKLISIPFAFLTLVFLYMTWKVDSDYSLYILIGFIPLALLYIMSSEIDWWWWSKNPPDIEPAMAEMLENGLPFYQGLSTSEKLVFRQKVAMFIAGNEWVPQVWEEIPRDVQVGIAAQAVIPLFDRKEWLYPNWETIVVHPASFMSPTYPYAHYSETFEPDKCTLFSTEHVMKTYLPGQAGQVPLALHEYLKVYPLAFGQAPSRSWAEMSGMPALQQEEIAQATGVREV